MFEVSVSGWFAAAHQIRLPDGQLEPLHGHNWQVSVTWRGPELDAHGLLLDFVALRERLTALLAEFHDRNLNDLPVFEGGGPSAERVARVIAQRLAAVAAPGERPVALHSVEVEEAPGCRARYYPGAAHSPVESKEH